MEISVFTRYNECLSGLQYKPQDRWIFRYRQCIYTQQMEEIKYGREKTPETQTGNGNSEYEEWRKRMLATPQREAETGTQETADRHRSGGGTDRRWSVGRRNCFKQQVCFRIRQESGNF